MSETAELLGQAIELGNMTEAPETTGEMPVEGADVPANETATEGEMPQNTDNQEPAEGSETPGATEPDYIGFVKKEFGEEYDLETLKSHIEKAKSYDEIARQKEELEKNQFKPANDYVRTLNTLVESGASKDQLNSFIKLNTYGDLDKMSPMDIKVAKMVLIDNYSEDVARAKVERDFDLSQYEEGDIDRRILEDELRVSSKKDLEALNDYRAELSTYENPDKANAEKIQLEEKAILTQHQNRIKAELPELVKRLKPVRELEFGIKDVEGKVPFSIEYDEEFKNQLPSLFEPMFKDKVEPINEMVAEKFAKSVYLEENFDRIAQQIWDKAVSFATEHADGKYENRSGLPETKPNPEALSDKNETYKFMEKLASGTF